MNQKRKNLVLLLVIALALIGAGISLYVQLSPPAQAEPPAAPVAQAGSDQASPDGEAEEGDEELDFQDDGRRWRGGGFALPEDYDGPLDGSQGPE